MSNQITNYKRCPMKFMIGEFIFKCDLQDEHYGNHISLPEYPNKLATVMWNNED